VAGAVHSLTRGTVQGQGQGLRRATGCTGGHDVCGLSRLSLRTLVNMAALMGAGFALVYLIKHLG